MVGAPFRSTQTAPVLSAELFVFPGVNNWFSFHLLHVTLFLCRLIRLSLRAVSRSFWPAPVVPSIAPARCTSAALGPPSSPPPWSSFILVLGEVHPPVAFSEVVQGPKTF